MADIPRNCSTGTIGLLCTFLVLNFSYRTVTGLAADPIISELRLSPAEYGAISSSFYLFFSLSSILVGLVAYRASSRLLLGLLSLLCAMALAMVFTPALGLITLVAALILLGIAAGPGNSQAYNCAFTWYPEESRSRASTTLAVATAASVLAIPVLQTVVTALGWRSGFGALAIAGVAWSTVWLRRARDGPYGDVHPDQDVPASSTRLTHRQACARIFSTGTWIGCVVSGFGVAWGFSVAGAWLPLFLSRAGGFSDQHIGLVIAVPGALSVLFLLMSNRLARTLTDRGFARRTVHRIFNGGVVALAGASMIAMAAVNSRPWSLVFMSLAFSVGIVQTSFSNSAIADISPPAQRGASLGVRYAVTSVASVIAPFVTGLIVSQSVNGFAWSFFVSGVLLLSCGLVSIAIVNPARDTFNRAFDNTTVGRTVGSSTQ
ncbi:MFS transporter [Plantactinospora sp. DSM 117369]